MKGGDELRLLRQRLAELEDRLARLEAADGFTSQSLAVVTVSQGSYPTSAASPVFYAVTRQDVTGTEAEGASASLASVTDTFYAVNLGTAVPPVGTKLVVDYSPHRWAFRFDG